MASTASTIIIRGDVRQHRRILATIACSIRCLRPRLLPTYLWRRSKNQSQWNKNRQRYHQNPPPNRRTVWFSGTDGSKRLAILANPEIPACKNDLGEKSIGPLQLRSRDVPTGATGRPPILVDEVSLSALWLRRSSVWPFNAPGMRPNAYDECPGRHFTRSRDDSGRLLRLLPIPGTRSRKVGPDSFHDRVGSWPGQPRDAPSANEVTAAAVRSSGALSRLTGQPSFRVRHHGFGVLCDVRSNFGLSSSPIPILDPDAVIEAEISSARSSASANTKLAAP